MTEYNGTLARIGFSFGTFGPSSVVIDVDGHGFILDGADQHTLNGVAVTLAELVAGLCSPIEPQSVKVRIVWDEHRYGNVREAHFTTVEAKP